MARLTIEDNNLITVFDIPSYNSRFLVGRSKECEIVLKNQKVSRKHAEISVVNNEIFITDLNSTNGTFVNGVKIKKRKLIFNDEIRIGEATLKLMADSITSSGMVEPKKNSEVNFELSGLKLSDKIWNIHGELLEVQRILSSNSEQTVFNKVKQIDKSVLGLQREVIELARENKVAKTIYEIGNAIGSILNLRHLLVVMLEMALSVVRAERGAVILKDEKTGELNIKIITSRAKKQSDFKSENNREILCWEACKQVFDTNRPLVTNKALKDPRFAAYRSVKDNNILSMIIVPIRAKNEPIGVIYFDNQSKLNFYGQGELEFLLNFSTQAGIAIENAKLYSKIQKIYLSTIRVLTAALDAKDSYTQGHSMRVTEYSMAIAEELKLPEVERERIEYAGLLHDIGKIGISDYILCKPGKLTEEEFQIIKSHPVTGAKIIEPVEFLKDKVPLVRHHHEKFDGSGYPDGLKGKEIPLGARIIAVSDAFDAMTSTRAYRSNLPYEDALNEIKKNKGRQFDPEIADAFIRVFFKRFKEDFDIRISTFKKQKIVTKRVS